MSFNANKIKWKNGVGHFTFTRMQALADEHDYIRGFLLDSVRLKK